jgi:dihydrofolate reductase
MFNGQPIIFVSIVDNKSLMMPHLNIRIWHHQKLINRLLENETCIIGRKTFDITRWKGSNSWVLTRKRDWSRSGIGTIHDIDDIHLHSEGPVHVLGGSSLFKQFESYVDEIHLYVINGDEGREPWIKINMRDWKPQNYTNRGIWSYAHLIRMKNYDPYKLNQELFDI